MQRALILPENRLDAKLDLAHDEAADVVAEELAEDFVLHRRVGLAHHAIAELRLDHAEHGLGIAPLMVVLGEVLLIELVVQEHLLPEPPGFALDAVALERDVRRPAKLMNELQGCRGSDRLCRRALP